MSGNNAAVAQQQKAPMELKTMFGRKSVQQRFEEMLGKKAPGFISSVLQIVSNNKLLSSADPNTVLTAAATAATLDLPVNPNLGFSWIVPYKGQAAFQMGWRGYVQLALRTGQYKNINAIKVYENQFKNFNVLTEELDADFSVDGEGKVVGYAAYFSLVNGFEKLSYWSEKKVRAHAKKYSQAYSSKYSPWSDPEQFHAMAMKTVLKNTLSKWGIMSIELQTAVIADQSVQREEGNYQYPDNDNTIDIVGINESEEEERIKKFMQDAKTKEELQEMEPLAQGNLFDVYEEKMKEFEKPEPKKK